MLAEHDDPAPLSIQEIATRADAPRKFLEAILLELRKDGVLTIRLRVRNTSDSDKQIRFPSGTSEFDRYYCLLYTSPSPRD